MNDIQRKRLLKLADYLVEKVPKEKFDMTRFGTSFGKLTDCGSAGCALGWSTVLFRNIGCTVAHGVPTYEGRIQFGVGVSLFGLTYEQSEKLFSITSYEAASGSGKSAKQVRRDIIRLVAKLDKGGEV